MDERIYSLEDEVAGVEQTLRMLEGSIEAARREIALAAEPAPPDWDLEPINDPSVMPSFGLGMLTGFAGLVIGLVLRFVFR